MSDLQKTYRNQKAALTRAVNSGDAEKVYAAVRKAVQEWDTWEHGWPDNWSRWQRALDDLATFPGFVGPRVDDFRVGGFLEYA